MTPQELLKETQRAVGGEEMLQDHQKLIDLWNEHKTITAVRQSHNITKVELLRREFL